MEINEDVVIVGAGIAGVATAVALKRVGIRALTLEKSDGLRTTGAAINLLPNAWLALDALGVSHKLTSIYPLTLRVNVTDIATGAVQKMSFDGNNGPRLVHRRALLEALAEELPVDSFRFSSKIVSIKVDEQGGASCPVLCLEDGTTIKSKVLIGCDGVHSIVAKWLGLSAPIHSGRFAVRGLAVYPEGHGYKQEEVYQFVDVGKRVAFIPLNDKELFWFSSGHEGESMQRDPQLIKKEVVEKFAKDFPSDYLDVVRNADLSSITWAPLKLRAPWNVIFGNIRKGNVTVAGDAMHPMTPDLAQGGCAALEDAVVLGRHIGNSFIKNGRNIVEKEMGGALDGYVKERRWRAAALITGSYLSGWVQQDGSNWLLKFIRDSIFYLFLIPKINRFILYDCGKLPTSTEDLHSSNKTD